MSRHLCPYCGGPLTENCVCKECGSLGNSNRQYYDPLEQSWQQGRFLRNLKYGKVIAFIALAWLLVGMILSIVSQFN